MTIVNNTAYFKVARVLKVLISRKKKTNNFLTLTVTDC